LGRWSQIVPQSEAPLGLACELEADSAREREMTEGWTIEELRRELGRFETELRRAGLKESSITTYVDRSGRFVSWLAGEYAPRGPN
jgi:hypothetical protein